MFLLFVGYAVPLSFFCVKISTELDPFIANDPSCRLPFASTLYDAVKRRWWTFIDVNCALKEVIIQKITLSRTAVSYSTLHLNLNINCSVIWLHSKNY